MDLDPIEESTLMSKDHVLRGTYALSISLRVGIRGIRHLNTFVYVKANLQCAACYVVLDPSGEHTANTHWGAPPKQLLISKQTDNYIKLLEYDTQV